jgi:hypothetical protein
MEEREGAKYIKNERFSNGKTPLLSKKEPFQMTQVNM